MLDFRLNDSGVRFPQNRALSEVLSRIIEEFHKREYKVLGMRAGFQLLNEGQQKISTLVFIEGDSFEIKFPIDYLVCLEEISIPGQCLYKTDEGFVLEIYMGNSYLIYSSVRGNFILDGETSCFVNNDQKKYSGNEIPQKEVFEGFAAWLEENVLNIILSQQV